MSQYISSYLIEPVVRQARRFSRPEASESSAQEAGLRSSLRLEAADLPDSLPENESSQQGYQQSPRVQHPPLYTNSSIGELSEAYSSSPDNDGIHEQDSEFLRRASSILGSRTPRRRSTSEQYVSANASFPNSINRMGSRYMEESGQSTRSSLTQTSLSPRNSIVDSELPEDDGMGPLRRKILDIQQLSAPNTEKSRLMHGLMMESYASNSQVNNLRAQSPSSLQSHDRPFTPLSNHSTDLMLIDSPNTAVSTEEDIYVTNEERKPTYYSTQMQIKVEDDRPFGCSHYKRNVKLQCSTCLRWYTCRFCHDQNEDHCLNRRATKNMLCMACGFAQPASQDCSNCGQLAAWYFCKICKLWDDDATKSIYHCNDCGLCRRGEGLGKDFFHCKKCCACISMQIRDTHKCIERSTDSDCPICGEYMFSSPKTVIFMRCGHSIHHACWKEHMQNSFKCPICSKSMVNMEITFRQYDLDIEAQPMPPQFRDTKAWIFCNDCSAKSLVKYHWIGLKCAICDSYNTARLQILSGPDNATTSTNNINLLMSELSESITRGRSTSTPEQIRATSASAMRSFRPTPHPYRNAQSTSPTAMDRLVFPLQLDDDISDAMDTSEDEVDFWGGESPRERMLHQRKSRTISTSETSSESDDESTTDEMEEDEEDDDDEIDPMEIFGHR